MKLPLQTLGAAVLLALANVAGAATPATSTISPEPRFVPRDEAAGDVSWTRFRDRLLTAVQQRDRKFVLGIVDRNVRNGLERPRGMEEFVRQWDPEADDSPLWRELPRALHLAAAYYRHDQMPRSLCAPYVLPQWPQDIDPHTYGAITTKQTDVRAAPSGNSEIQFALGHVIVPVTDWEVADRDADVKQKWVKIRTRERDGYIPEEHIRSPIEHLVCFRRGESGWRLTSFLAAGE